MAVSSWPRRLLNQDGFAFIPAMLPERSTIEVARTLGLVADIAQMLPASGVPTVQSLRPRFRAEVGDNQYSGNFGFGAFPLHTDLAHWAVPPRYLLLRCVVGTEQVSTCVLHWSDVIRSFGLDSLRKSVFRARKRRRGSSGLVRAASFQDLAEVFRWDPIFLVPMNDYAVELGAVFRNPAWDQRAHRVLLHERGDLLLIDNWRVLHGRDSVSRGSANRWIDRVYLSEVST